MNKQPQVTEKTRQRFIEVFCELYSQKPIEKISIQEIANRSGYNRSTFYQYFTDIYELLDAVENNLLHDIKQNLLIKSCRCIQFRMRSLVWTKKNIS
ncbi:TetR/AcrR family transcriptional regulator [Paenibacillus rhizoplanae]|uniref:TetR/AcrR family transcriptional regulator n=1 Tax=Paenibacillus rhizoplanae TaxID=1917181 RepID=UPI003615664C